MRLDYPVIGPLSANPGAIEPPADFLRFAAPCGVHGLAQVKDRELHLLSVCAVTTTIGQFRNFIGQCKQSYQFIRMWAVMDDSFRATLTRYGFQKGADVDKFGDFQEVWDWHYDHRTKKM